MQPPIDGLNPSNEKILEELLSKIPTKVPAPHSKEELAEAPHLYRETTPLDWNMLHTGSTADKVGESQLAAFKLANLLNLFDRKRGVSVPPNLDTLKEPDETIDNRLKVGDIVQIPKGWDFMRIDEEKPSGIELSPTAKFTYFKVIGYDYNVYILEPLNRDLKENNNPQYRIPWRLVSADNPQQPINWKSYLAPSLVKELQPS